MTVINIFSIIKKQSGFTLAEVLITLGIIGVVAAMTIPTLVANFQKQQSVVGFKKMISTLDNAFANMANENGCVGDLSCTGIFNTTDPTIVINRIAPYLKTLKICGASTAGCWHTGATKNLTGGDYATLDSHPALAHAILIDGTNILLDMTVGADCTNTGYVSGTTTCATIMFDVNGNKPPNTLGRDIFNTHLTNNAQLYPMGGNKSAFLWSSSSSTSCNPTLSPTASGLNCAGRIMEQGWEMNY